MNNESTIRNDAIRIGSNIRRLRIARDLRPQDLIRELNLRGVNMTSFALSKIEADTQHIKASQFKAIAEILGCSADDLLKSESEQA